MPANEIKRYKKPGQDFTGEATAAITGRKFVNYSANRDGGGAAALGSDLTNVPKIAHATAAGPACGVANHDAASGSLVGVTAGGIVSVTSGGTIAAGAEVEVGAAGVAVTIASGKAVGICVTGTTVGLIAEIDLY
jgi:hypothetical protein